MDLSALSARGPGSGREGLRSLRAECWGAAKLWAFRALTAVGHDLPVIGSLKLSLKGPVDFET